MYQRLIQDNGSAGRAGLPIVCDRLVSVDDIQVPKGLIYSEKPVVGNIRLVVVK